MISSINWKIVLIDDDDELREVVSIVLEDAGYEVHTAKDGESGMRLCEQNAPQIVITDIRLPGLNGIQVLDFIKKEYRNIEVIVITAFGETDFAAQALQLDASDFIIKPMDNELLFIALKRAQNRYILNEQLSTGSKPDKEEARLPGKAQDFYRYHNDFIESALDGALVCDEKDLIVGFNRRLEQMLGYSIDEVLHAMTLEMLFSAKEFARFKSEMAGWKFGGKNRLDVYDTHMIGKSNEIVPIQLSAKAISDHDQGNGIVCYVKDLRLRKILCDQWVELIDQFNIGAFTIDLNRRITSFNSSAQALIGSKEAEVLGKDCREVFCDIPCYSKCPSQVDGNYGTKELPVEITDKANVKHLVSRLSTPLYGPGDQVIGCITVLQDHAALADLINRVNYEERSLKMILDNLDIGIFTVNRGGHFTFFNKAAEIMSGYKRQQVLGRPSPVIFGKNETVDSDMLNESITLGEFRVNYNSRIITPDGEPVPARADYMPLYDDHGKIVGGLATLKDLTLAKQLSQIMSDKYTFHSMIGKEPSMQKIFETVEMVAESNATVLIEGATGTGKDILAKVMHSAGNRADKPMVKVNCAALPDTLLESELFGYVKGAFTGAEKNKPGRFQEADRGTIFLDEIGDLPLSLQAKLLRVLEDREFYPLGSRNTVKVDVRVISATNRGLEELVQKRQFREDLFFRLNVLQIQLPPLKDRKSDIPLLIRHIIRKLCAAGEGRSCEVSRNAMKMLLQYDYPGNVRELQNVLEHAYIVCQGNAIEPEHLPLLMQNRLERIKAVQPEGKFSPANSAVPERETLVEILRQHNGHRNKTAMAMGIDRTTLWRKMKQHDLL